jgi:hypothetical protein
MKTFLNNHDASTNVATVHYVKRIELHIQLTGDHIVINPLFSLSSSEPECI